MRQWKRMAMVFLCCVTLLCGCTAKPANTTEAAAPADMRVVALSRSIAELWLLAGGTLTGTTEDAAELDTQAAVVGSLTAPSLEAILALSPDLVLLSAQLPVHKEIKAQLDGMRIAARSVNIDSFEDYAFEMIELTALTGRADLLEQNVTQVREKIDSMIAASPLKDLPQQERPTYFAVRVSATKNKALKRDYFACAVFDDMGLVNIAADNPAFDTLDPEALLAADPDYIFVIPQGDEAEAQESFQKAFSSRPVWKNLSAVKAQRVFHMPKELFQLKPNANWGEAYQYVLNILLEKN